MRPIADMQHHAEAANEVSLKLIQSPNAARYAIIVTRAIIDASQVRVKNISSFIAIARQSKFIFAIAINNGWKIYYGPIGGWLG